MTVKKGFIFVAVLLLLALSLAACSSPESADLDEKPTENDVSEPGDPEHPEEELGQLFTMDDIAQYDGKDGRPAYIVVDGIVYDVTDVPQWRSGSHFGFVAGTDVTDALANSAPHGAGLLKNATIVGSLKEQ